MVKKNKKKSEENESVVAGLSYILIGIIWYLVDEKVKKNNFVKFHVKQSINLLIFSIIGSVVISIISILLAFTFILAPLGMLIHMVFGIIVLVLFVLGLINGFGGNKKKLPLIGEYADKYLKF